MPSACSPAPYGFASWTRLAAAVQRAATSRFFRAAEQGDLPTIRTLVAARPDLVRLDRAENDEHTALHYAVLNRDPACTHFLLEAGADPHKGIYGEYAMAETLLDAGADVNAMVYASGCPLERAYGAGDERMKALLLRQGALVPVETIGLYRDVQAARDVIEGRAPAVTDRRHVTAYEQLLWAGACGGEPEIVELCRASIVRRAIRGGAPFCASPCASGTTARCTDPASTGPLIPAALS